MVESPLLSTAVDAISPDPRIQHHRRGIEQNMDDLLLSFGKPSVHFFPVVLDQDCLYDDQVIASELGDFGRDQRNQ